MKKPKKNVRLFRKIMRAILAEPRRLEMDSYVDKYDDIAPCGTTACIAGHAVVIDYMEKNKGVGFKEAAYHAIHINTHKDAIRLLGITEIQAARLFFRDEWPEAFMEEYNALNSNAKLTPKGRRIKLAKLTVERIKHFLKEGR